MTNDNNDMLGEREGFFVNERKVNRADFEKTLHEAPARATIFGRQLGDHVFDSDEGLDSFLTNQPDLHDMMLRSKERKGRLRAATDKDRRKMGALRQRATACFEQIGRIMEDVHEFSNSTGDEDELIEFYRTFVSPKVGTYRFFANTNFSGELWSLITPGLLHLPVPAIAGSDDNNMGSMSIFKPLGTTAVILYDGTCYTGTKHVFGTYPDKFTRSVNLANYGFNNRVSSFWFMF